MIAIIGRGNVATHLFRAFKGKTNVTLVNPHNLIDMPEDPDLILICVTDQAISQIVDKLKYTKSIIAHTAGSVSMDVLKDKSPNYGVFYPLQTFTINSEITYSDIPVFIEGSTKDTINKLKEVAELFTTKIREINSEERKQLHLASVFANNFTNAMAVAADSLLKKAGFDFSVVLPLMKQTIRKLENITPLNAQTGPAKRKDLEIIKTHLEMLESDLLLRDLYSQLSTLISKQQEKDSI